MWSLYKRKECVEGDSEDDPDGGIYSYDDSNPDSGSCSHPGDKKLDKILGYFNNQNNQNGSGNLAGSLGSSDSSQEKEKHKVEQIFDNGENNDDKAPDYSKHGEKLEPLKFSNGKTQGDVVKEILGLIEKGSKIIFLKGVCGTGKSAIALNLARHFKKTSIVVPIKSLQEQYEQDYTKNKFILKEDGKRLKICVIKGRGNFSCPFSQSDTNMFIKNRVMADGDELPCSIELRDKNTEKIKEYIQMNEDVHVEDFANVSDVRRMSVAPACPYWSPLLPAEINTKVLEHAKKKKYMAVCGKEYALFQRKKGCGYYDQYIGYIESDVLIFNAAKYLLESAIGRKPKTDLEIIDECDDFLDSFATEKRINLNRLVVALSNLFPPDREMKNAIKEILHIANDIIFSSSIFNDEGNGDVEKIGETRMKDLVLKIIENPYLADDEDNNYYNNAFEIAKSFENLLDETYVSFDRSGRGGNGEGSFGGGKQQGLFGFSRPKEDETVIVNLVSINLAQKFKDLVEQNNVLVLMSGTLHSEKVLKDIFGLDSFKVVEAELEMPGTVSKFRTGLEKNCKYENFASGAVTRENYLKALSACVSNADAPVLVHVSSFSDLPSQEEIEDFKLSNLISREKLKEMQFKDSSNKRVDDFKSGNADVLFTTKCSRGVDFAGDKCRSIILTKYPYPNIQSLFWKILKKEQPNKFMEFYMDKARRELVQKIARGVRFKGDHVLLLSPDSRVLDARVN